MFRQFPSHPAMALVALLASPEVSMAQEKPGETTAQLVTEVVQCVSSQIGDDVEGAEMLVSDENTRYKIMLWGQSMSIFSYQEGTAGVHDGHYFFDPKRNGELKQDTEESPVPNTKVPSEEAYRGVLRSIRDKVCGVQGTV